MWFLHSFVILAVILVTTNGYGVLDSESTVAERLSYLYYRGSVTNNVTIPLLESEKLIDEEGFSLDKITVFYGGGWNTPMDEPQVLPPIYSYLNHSDTYNVVQINFTYYANGPSSTFYNTAKLGPIIAHNIQNLIDTKGLDPTKIHLVGLSLGAQLVGQIAKYVKVALLVGLDPAGSKYDTILPSYEKGHANFTITLHTDRGGFGTKYGEGDLDFRIQDGSKVQSGCTNIPIIRQLDVCSHAKAIRIFGSALMNPELFPGVQCEYHDSCRLSCNTSDIAYISDKSRNVGVYYLTTSGNYPYGLGEEGYKNANEGQFLSLCKKRG